VDQLHDIITSTELPDIEVSAPAPSLQPDLVEPLPPAPSSDILGLLEYLETQGGTVDLFQVAAATHVTFEKILASVKGAEMLDFVDTPKRQVVLTPLGQRFVRANMDDRKDIWKNQLLELRLFRLVQELIDLHQGELKDDELLAELQQRLPMENSEQTFETLVTWGRFGELFAYREERGVLTPE
jgi:NitT/TauT family transport system ATP-binding protein